LPRFDAASRSATLELLPPLGVTPTPAQVGALRQVRNVSGVAGLRFYAMSLRRKPSSQPGAALDRKFGNVVDRARLIAGRLADPSAPNEIAISEGPVPSCDCGSSGSSVARST